MSTPTIWRVRSSVWVTLPDGSTVLLKPGTYDKSAAQLQNIPDDVLAAYAEPFEPDFGAVEEATANPGEKRQTVRKKGGDGAASGRSD